MRYPLMIGIIVLCIFSLACSDKTENKPLSDQGRADNPASEKKIDSKTPEKKAEPATPQPSPKSSAALEKSVQDDKAAVSEDPGQNGQVTVPENSGPKDEPAVAEPAPTAEKTPAPRPVVSTENPVIPPPATYPKGPRPLVIKNQSDKTLFLSLWLLGQARPARMDWFILEPQQEFRVPMEHPVMALTGMMKLQGELWQTIVNPLRKGGATDSVKWMYAKLPFAPFVLATQKQATLCRPFPIKAGESVAQYIKRCREGLENNNFGGRPKPLPALILCTRSGVTNLGGQQCLFQSSGGFFPTITIGSFVE